MRTIVAFVAFIFATQSCLAWSEGGHHLIAVMAFDLLDRDCQSRVVDLIQSHPEREKRFAIPQSVTNAEHWLIGTAAFWPDLARKSSFDRPKWHYIQQATTAVGDVDVPLPNLAIPHGANLESKELNIVQAIKLCRNVLADKSQTKESRAVALCWLCHLIGDAHQPCHAGSFYAAKVFPDGDRGGNEIPTKQRRNLHALWDSLLGPKYEEGDVRRRASEIRRDTIGWRSASTDSVKDPAEWIAGSVRIATVTVYTPEIVDQIKAAIDKGAAVEKISLSKPYLKVAGEVSHQRAAFAAHRLARTLTDALK